MELLNTVNLNALNNLEILAKQIVEGYITGIHKSPFHGFSVEFAEHRLYNTGESTRHIDWKLYAKTKKLFVKKFEEETNLRCHLVIDNSASMNYPNNLSERHHSKLQFSVYAAAALIELLKRQRDAVGLSIYSNETEFYAPARGNERHRRKLLNQLENILQESVKKETNTVKALHEISEKIHKRSMVFVFTDMFQQTKNELALIEALRHLKYNKHEVVLFHVFDKRLEFNFEFDNNPRKFVDVETGEQINLYGSSIQKKYQEKMQHFVKELKLKCMQYKIDFVPIDINEGFEQLLTTYLIHRNQFL
ncbi:MAG: DUF58 domain-containing protein [Lutibacter sp.]